MYFFSAKGLNQLSKFIFFMGILGIVIAAGFGLHRWSFLQKAVSTDAMVTELVEKKDDDGLTYAPVYIFKDQQGVDFKTTSQTSSNPPIAQVGDKIKILYLPEQPKKSVIDHFLYLWGVSVISAGFGILEIIFASLLFYFARKRIKSL